MLVNFKKLIYRSLGQKAYLKILNTGFFSLYYSGVLKSNDIYKYHYFVKYLVKPGDTVIDIGANLGYFSKIFAGLTKNGGALVAIEPVKPFYEILTQVLRPYKQATCYNYALGFEEKTITMSVPNEYGYLRTGVSHVTGPGESAGENYTFEARMVRGSELLRPLSKIDYIKCDVEGYEGHVLPELKEILKTHTPMVQVETIGESREIIINLMIELGYHLFYVENNKLVKQDGQSETPIGDILFIHERKEESVLEKLKSISKY